ncbi:Acg family FMN-binding oxidoreductase [Paenibacillus donghaensis]|uniref:Nitroreductase domain-containing protein n=1 Tax=Paenibacillus donghaensis TaxID=414771 RepID=A0A2Z2KYV6_9BACL|nr:hypothetical protein [Paenibacillus donghaensis]ASA25868.1 hypothetical protein B9T62_37160 [Paenibacillus donghaensis]
MKRKGRRRAVFIALAGILTLLLTAVAVLLVVSGVFAKPHYLQPWEQGYAQRFTDPRVELAAHGLLAASGHNMQPWVIRLDEQNPMSFELFADSQRLTPGADPYARQLMISQGTFLEYVSIAGEQLGYGAEVELFPEGEYEEKNLADSLDMKPVARITLTKQAPVASRLYPYLFRPDTNRGAYREEPLTGEQLRQLQNLNESKDMTVSVTQDGPDLERIKEYTSKAAVVEAGVERVMQETETIFRSNEAQKNKYRYGFSVEGQGTAGIKRHLLQGLVTLFPSLNRGEAAAKQYITSAEASIGNSPAFAMIVTADNSRVSQVRSGMLYSRLTLEAHRLGLALQPLSQALEEYDEMKQVYSSIHHSYAASGGTIQMLARVGAPLKEAPLSMRRNVMELVPAE